MLASRRILTLAAVLLIGSGCASDLEVGASYDPLMVFPAQATYAWNDSRNQLPADTRLERLEFDRVIREAVSAEFGAMDYREVAAGQPSDYLMSYQLGVDTRYRPEGTVSVGSLSLLLSDTASKRRVWVGFARAPVDFSNPKQTHPDRVAGFRVAVESMLKKFPTQHHK